jgi:hypothetical protein
MSRFLRLSGIAIVLVISGCATRPRGAPPPPLVDDKLYSCHENSETDGKTVNAAMDCTVSLQADPAKFRGYIEEHASKLCKGLSRYIVTEYHETAPPLGSDAAKFRHVDVKIQCQ